ncbi:hypothetical protein [Sphingomonas oligophenolica]|nr:hypothetical protein [Sphingomonas oligophenolica]
MTIVDIAERKSIVRAIFFLALAAALVLLLMVTFAGGVDFLNGLWAGLMIGASLNLLPFARWVKARNPVALLLDDESTREHRHIATTRGFWAAVVATLAMTIVSLYVPALTAYDAVRVIGTAGMAAALIAFAALELRASR